MTRVEHPIRSPTAVETSAPKAGEENPSDKRAQLGDDGGERYQALGNPGNLAAAMMPKKRAEKTGRKDKNAADQETVARCFFILGGKGNLRNGLCAETPCDHDDHPCGDNSGAHPGDGFKPVSPCGKGRLMAEKPPKLEVAPINAAMMPI